MQFEEWKIFTYVTDTNKNPFNEWLLSLDRTARLRIEMRLDRIRTGNFGDYKSLGNGLYELRLFFGPGYRIYYGIVGEKVVLLLGGGQKRGQSRDIKKANEYLEKHKLQQKELTNAH